MITTTMVSVTLFISGFYFWSLLLLHHGGRFGWTIFKFIPFWLGVACFICSWGIMAGNFSCSF